MSARAPQAAAIVDLQGEVSFGELLARTRRVASAWRREGVRRGDRVGAILSNRREWLELAFAASAVGAAFTPFSTWSTRGELAYLIADSRIKLLFALARSADRDYAGDLAALTREGEYPALSRIVLVGGEGDGFPSYEAFARDAASEDDPPPGVAAGAADDALVLYTSGSSARPKAVRLKHHGIVENGFNIGERMGLGAGDRVLLPAPLFWSYGSANALPAAFTHGAALVLQERFEPGGAIELVERQACTAIYTLPAMTAAIARHPAYRPERLATLRTGLTIGSPQEFLSAVKTLGAGELCNIYGATETYGNCCVTSSRWPLERRAACQGEPLPGNRLRLVDVETGAPCGPGETGLVEVQGYVTPGYDGGSADQNAAAFTADGYYRTGDAGRIDPDGAFVFVARHAEMIKRAGVNVSPAEVEEVLARHSGVAQAAVVGAPDVERGELIVAYVVPRGELSASALVAHCREHSSKYKVPDHIEFLDALPLTVTGKLARRALKDAAAGWAAKTKGRADG